MEVPEDPLQRILGKNPGSPTNLFGGKLPQWPKNDDFQTRDVHSLMARARGPSCMPGSICVSFPSACEDKVRSGYKFGVPDPLRSAGDVSERLSRPESSKQLTVDTDL